MQAESGRRVLVVDDSKFVRTTFRNILSSAFTVLEEGDGEAGWQVVSTDSRVVIVFTDLDMPKLDGFALLARIRGSSDARVRAMPVAIITGDEQAATKKRAREAGASSFISKSADAREILTRIDRLLKMVRSSPRPAPAPAVTGVMSERGLRAEGQRHYDLARRHGAELSILALRIDSRAELVRLAGPEVAEQLLAQIARVIVASLRSGDALGRASADTFVLLAPGLAAPQLGAVAQRLSAQLAAAQVAYQGRPLAIACSIGLAAAAIDGAARSFDDLMGLALRRLKPVARPPALGEELERALRVLEAASRGGLGPRAQDLERRRLAIAKTLKAAQQ